MDGDPGRCGGGRAGRGAGPALPVLEFGKGSGTGSIRRRRGFRGLPSGPGGPGAFFSAPGRVELGGNHTDHQRGHVLCAGVEADLLACAAANGTGRLRLRSPGFSPVEVDLADLTPRRRSGGPPPPWCGEWRRLCGRGAFPWRVSTPGWIPRCRRAWGSPPPRPMRCWWGSCWTSFRPAAGACRPGRSPGRGSMRRTCISASPAGGWTRWPLPWAVCWPWISAQIPARR